TLDQLRSAAFGEVVEAVGSLIMMDPPQHERNPKLWGRPSPPRRIAAGGPVVARVVGNFLDRLAGASAFDVVEDFSGPFPIEVISEIVGIPPADRQQLRLWTDAVLEREVGNPFPTAAGIEAAIAQNQYLRALGADRRDHPGDDMLGHLLTH